MPSEGFKIEKKEVAKTINSEIESSGISIGEKEQKIIDNVINSCPLELRSMQSLTNWCNQKVNIELEKYPDMNKDIQEIHNKIGKELMFKLDSEKFEELKRIVEIEKPETINPEWMGEHPSLTPLLRRIQQKYKNIDGTTDYNFVMNKLGLNDKFSKREKRNSVNWGGNKERIINAVVDLVEKENPTLINPKWIQKNDSGLLAQIGKNFRTIDGKIDWDTIKSSLDDKWQSKWTYQEQNSSILKGVENIVRVFESEKLTQISPNWIDKRLHNDYVFITEHIERDENGKIKWQFFVDLLPENVAKCWVKIKRMDITLQKLADNFIRVFEEKKPTKVSPEWIIKNLPKDYGTILSHLRDKNGVKNWDKFINLLPENMAKCWSRVKKTEELIPDKSYLDNNETDEVVNKHRNKMYTFYSLVDKEEDKEEREKIIKEMQKIILNGNLDALDRLAGHLMFTAEGWIENDPSLKIWKYAKEELRKNIEKCIYRFDFAKGKSKFSTYLYAWLKYNAKALKKNSNTSLKKNFSDGKVEYHDDDEEEKE